MRILFPHQKSALNWAIPRSTIALFMEMRLGKTLVCIRWLQEKRAQSVLIIAPSAVITTWRIELQTEGVIIKDISILQGPASTRIKLAEEQKTWNLINYEGLLSAPEILAMKWDAVILDESSRIKNPKAQITKLINSQLKDVTYKAILSGYPCPESEMDYFEQIKFVNGNFMGFENFWAWRNIACVQFGFKWEIKYAFKERLKKEVEESAFILTRKDVNIGSKKIYEKRFIPMVSAQKKVYEEVKKDFAYTYKNSKGSTRWIPVKLEWLSQIAGGFSPETSQLISEGKCKEILILLKGELKDQKIVIWFKHTCELNYVYSQLRQKFRVGRFTGTIKEGDLSKDIDIMLAQTKCGQMGLDWSVASTAIYYSNWWSGEIRIQSEDRIIHPQKKEPVLYIDLLTENSIDTHILDLLKKKKINSEQFLLELSRRTLDD